MQKRFTSHSRKRFLALSLSCFGLISCSGSLPYWLNEEQKKEVLSSIESMTPDENNVRFYCPKENYSEDHLCYEELNFDIYTCVRTKEGILSFKKNGEKESTDKQANGQETAYEYGLSCLETLNVRNAFSLADFLPFVKDSSKKAKGIKGSHDYPGYWFDMDQSVFDSESFKSFRQSHFNTSINGLIEEKGFLQFEVDSAFKTAGLIIGSFEKDCRFGTIFNLL